MAAESRTTHRGAPRWRRTIVTALATTGAVTVAGALWLLLPIPLVIDRWLNTSEPPAQADAIVCIGGGTTSFNLPTDEGWYRINTSVQLFTDDFAPVLVFSGRGGSRMSEAEIYGEAATWLGLPREPIRFDPLPSSTAEHPLTLLASQPALTRRSRLLVVTSPMHSRRVRLSFVKQGFTNVRVVSRYVSTRKDKGTARHARESSIPQFSPSGKVYNDPILRLRWKTRDLFVALRELAALAWYRWNGLV